MLNDSGSIVVPLSSTLTVLSLCIIERKLYSTCKIPRGCCKHVR